MVVHKENFMYAQNTIIHTSFSVTVGYTMDTMYFSPLPNAIDIADDLQMPQFSLVAQKLIDCSQNYTSGTPVL